MELTDSLLCPPCSAWASLGPGGQRHFMPGPEASVGPQRRPSLSPPPRAPLGPRHPQVAVMLVTEGRTGLYGACPSPAHLRPCTRALRSPRPWGTGLPGLGNKPEATCDV